MTDWNWLHWLTLILAWFGIGLVTARAFCRIARDDEPVTTEDELKSAVRNFRGVR